MRQRHVARVWPVLEREMKVTSGGKSLPLSSREARTQREDLGPDSVGCRSSGLCLSKGEAWLG